MTNHLHTIESYLTQIAFRGNQNLRVQGTVISYTDEMIDELIKCKLDPCYFISKYIKVIHPDKGMVTMELFDYQNKMINTYKDNRKVVFLTARQQGKTTVSAAYFVWFILFNDNKTVGVLANKQQTADEIMGRVRLMYENLPKWMQQGVCAWNRRSIELENGSRIFGAPTSASAVRGRSLSILYIDEYAFVGNNLAEEFFTAVYPTITAGKETKVFITSTPNGFNHFYKIWNEAEKGLNGFVPLRIHWHETPGRDAKWYNEQKAVLGELKAAQEIDAEFLGSSLTLLTGATMSRLSARTPVKWYKDGMYAGLKIYENPSKDKNYAMTVDVSRGRHLDYSTFMVFDVTSYPHRIVASFRNNQIAPLMYAAIIQKTAHEYNDAYTLIEINDVGSQVAEELYYTYEYDNMFWTKSGERLGQKGADPYPGIRTTKKTKRIGCNNLKDIIDKEQLIVDDQDAIDEFASFVQSKAGSYEADEGFHDDMVMCLVLFAWLVTQPWFVDLFDKSMRNQMYSNLIHEMENDCLTIEYSNGLEDYHTETPEEAGLKVNW